VSEPRATNDPNDDQGAALGFPRQDFDNAAQPVGSLLARPSLVTHPHESAPLVGSTEFGLTIWCDLPGDVAMY